jgi:hypothetical protein
MAPQTKLEHAKATGSRSSTQRVSYALHALIYDGHTVQVLKTHAVSTLQQIWFALVQTYIVAGDSGY